MGPTVLAGPIFWPMEQSPAVLRFYRDWIAEAPDELMTIVIQRKAPPLAVRPAGAARQAGCGRRVLLRGPVDEGEAVVRPLKAFGSPVLDLCEPKPYVDHQAMFDASFPHGWWYYMRACDVAELSDEVIDITVEHAMRIQSPLTAFPIWQLGGAVARVGEDDDGVQRPRRRPHVQHHGHDGDRRRLRRGAGVGAGLLVGARAPSHERLRQLPHGGGRRSGSAQAYGAEKYDAPAGAEARVRPRQRLPLQPEHPALRGGAGAATWRRRRGPRSRTTTRSSCRGGG